MSKKNKKEKEAVEEEVLTAEKETVTEETITDPIEVLKSDLEKEKDRNLRLFAELMPVHFLKDSSLKTLKII